MSRSLPEVYVAGEREAGGTCAHCTKEVALGQSIAVCRQCGELHHETCWQLKRRCGSYDCSATVADVSSSETTVLRISRDNLTEVVPLPIARSASSKDSPGHVAPKWNRTSVAAFIISLIGIPLFGIITGLVAIVVACVALTGHSYGRRGSGLAVLAILIGFVDVVGWGIGLSHFYGGPQANVSFQDFAIDQSSLEELPAHIERAMRANVIIQVSAGLGRGGMGSGVVMAVRNKTAYIVTNRHVLDHSYSDSTTTTPQDLSSLGKVVVRTLDHASLPASIEWVAPGGIDLAIITVPILGDDVLAAIWDSDSTPKIGEKVFAVGNPHGLGWTHSAGDVSQIRNRTQGNYLVQIIQTTAAINSGNSGGGLYTEAGKLIGINTLTGDKRMAEGLGFSIALKTLLELNPPAAMTEAIQKVVK